MALQATQLSICLSRGGLTPGAYTNINGTVDAYGRLTAVANGSGGTGSGTVNSGTSGNGVLYPGTGTTVGPNVNQNWTAGAETIGQSGSVGGSTQWEGATSGFVKVQPPAVAGSTTITLPISPTNGYVVTTNGSGVWSYAAPSFTKFQSTQQTLTSGGTLTLAHSLGSMPSLVYFNLVCTTNNGGYTAGQVLTPFAGVQANNQGVSFTTDATNVYVQFGSASNIFEANNGSGGGSIGLANADWKLVVYAVI